jgi:hypothetical protein
MLVVIGLGLRLLSATIFVGRRNSECHQDYQAAEGVFMSVPAQGYVRSA